MNPALVLWLLALVPGVALLLDAVPWWRRRSVVARLRPHVTPAARSGGGTAAVDGRHWVSELLQPALQRAGDRLSRSVGLTEPLELRLRRAGRDSDPAAFRLAQLRDAVIGLGAAALAASVLTPPPLLGALTLVAGPVLAVLVDEQRLANEVADRARRIRLELPVVAEQLGLQVGAGLSLPAALARLAERGSGEIARDLSAVTLRIRHGVGEIDALREWADTTCVDGVERLVAVLSLHREATDLAALVVHEARSARQEAHRELIESIERRAQLVWVPVTVATLVPGLLFLAVPFVAALSGVAGN